MCIALVTIGHKTSHFDGRHKILFSRLINTTTASNGLLMTLCPLQLNYQKIDSTKAITMRFVCTGELIDEIN